MARTKQTVRQATAAEVKAAEKVKKAAERKKKAEEKEQERRNRREETQRQKKEKDDEYLATEAVSIAGYLKGNAIQSALHAANMLCVRSDYKGALGWTTKILDIDPTNSEAKQLVRTIQIAAAADSSWRWGWGRHGQRPTQRRQN